MSPHAWSTIFPSLHEPARFQLVEPELRWFLVTQCPPDFRAAVQPASEGGYLKRSLLNASAAIPRLLCFVFCMIY